MLSKNDHPITKFASDYKLYYLGEFSDFSGQFIQGSTPELMNHLSDFIDNQ